MRKVAIAGFGAIGKVLARRLIDGGLPGFELVVIGARDPARTRVEVESTLKRSIPVVSSTDLAGKADVLLDCVPTPAFRSVVEPALLAGYRQRLAANRLTAPLFDTKRFSRQIEQAYTTMWEIALRGEQPRAFAVNWHRSWLWLPPPTMLSFSIW